MSPIGYSDVFSSIESSMIDRFGDEIGVLDYNRQIVVAVQPKPKSETLIKFSQIMGLLSPKQSWYRKRKLAGEYNFEKALVELNMPLKARKSQTIKFACNPHPCSNALCGFLEDDEYSKDEKEKNENLRRCFETIDNALSIKKKYSYGKMEEEKDGQKKLYDFYRGQLEIDDIQANGSCNRKARDNNKRKIRFDIIYELENPESLILAEVKAFSTLANGILEERAHQLMAYDAWLNTVAGCRHPLMFVLPTAPSHREYSMLSEVGKKTGRDILPLIITGVEHLARDFKERKKTAKGVVSSANVKEAHSSANGARLLNNCRDIKPEVVDYHKKELEHIEKWHSGFLEALRA